MRRQTSVLLLAGGFWIMCISAQAQVPSQTRTATIKGVVRMLDGSSPFGVLVSITSTMTLTPPYAVQADAQGKFEFHDVAWSVYEITINHPGYRPVTRLVNVQRAASGFVIFELEPLPNKSAPAVPPEGPGAAIAAGVPPAAQEELRLGQDALDHDQEDEAIRHFEKALEIHPSFTEARLALGTAYMDKGNWEKAKEHLARVLKAQPNNASALLAAGACLTQEGSFEEAEGLLVRGLELEPDSAIGQYELARAYWHQKKWDLARPHAAQAVSLQPEVPVSHLLYGHILLRTKDGPAALHEFHEFLKLVPQGAVADSVRDLAERIEKALDVAARKE